MHSNHSRILLLLNFSSENKQKSLSLSLVVVACFQFRTISLSFALSLSPVLSVKCLLLLDDEFERQLSFLFLVFFILFYFFEKINQKPIKINIFIKNKFICIWREREREITKRSRIHDDDDNVDENDIKKKTYKYRKWRRKKRKNKIASFFSSFVVFFL